MIHNCIPVPPTYLRPWINNLSIQTVHFSALPKAPRPKIPFQDAKDGPEVGQFHPMII